MIIHPKYVSDFSPPRPRGRGKCITIISIFLLLLALSACQDAGQYFSRAHYTNRSETPLINPAEGSAVKNSAALRDAVKNAIDAHKTEEVIMVQNYDGDWDSDLQEIQREMLEEYPYGRYAINNLGVSSRTLFSQTEIRLSIAYRDSAVYMRDIVEVPNIGDFERRLSELMRDFVVGQAGENSISRVYFFTDFTDSAEDFTRRLMKCWTNSATRAIELREVSFVSFPDEGEQRIVEVNIQYMEERSAMLKRSESLASAARLAVAGFYGRTDEEKLDFVYHWLWDNVEFDGDAMGLVIEMDGAQSKRSIYTAYGALIDGIAAQSGYALAAQALCDVLGLNSRVITGHYGELPYYWLYISVNDEYVHFDPSNVKLSRWQNPPEPVEPPEEGELEPPIAEEDFSEHQYLFSPYEAALRFQWNAKVYDFIK